MDSSMFDGMYGKHFDFPVFENDFVIIQSAGYSINIGIKDKHKRVLHNWRLSYPFCDNYETPEKKECGWELTFNTRTKNEIKIIFGKEDARYTLAIICKDADAQLKPIEVYWE